MFRMDLLMEWGLAHLPYYDWYLDCPYDTIVESKCELKEKFGETNLEKATSTNSSLRGVKQSQIAKRVRKLKKQSARPSSENPNIEDFVEVVACGDEGATHDRMVKTPMTQRCLHNMNFYLSLKDLQGPTHEALDLSTDFLIQSSVSAFHLSWPNLVSAKALFGLWPFQYQELNGPLMKVFSR